MGRLRRRRTRNGEIDDRTRELFLRAVEGGNRQSVAAQLAGLNPRTVEEWLRRGRGDDDRPATPALTRFAEDYEAALARCEAGMVGDIRRGSASDPRLAIWWLENRSPEWRRRQQPLPAGPQQQPAQVTATTQVVIVSEEALERLGLERVRDMRQVGDGSGPGAEVRARLVEDAAAPSLED
jgi:hypothetical protein